MSRWLTDAIVIAGLSVAGYAMAFTYEAGFCRFFGLPIGLIRLDIVAVLAAMAATAVITAGALYMAAAFAERFGDENPVMLAVAETGFAISLLLPLVSLAGWQGPNMPMFAGFLAAPMTKPWLAPLLQFKEKGYLAKLRAYQLGASSKAASAFPGFGFALHPFWCAFAIGWWLQVSYLVGWSDAKKAETFFVVDGDPPLAVLRFYGDIALAIEVDPKSRSIRETIVVIPLDAERKFQRRKLGALRPLVQHWN